MAADPQGGIVAESGSTHDRQMAFGHVFESVVIEGTPVQACSVCSLTWWPYQRQPSQTCLQRQASDARRRS